MLTTCCCYALLYFVLAAWGLSSDVASFNAGCLADALFEFVGKSSAETAAATANGDTTAGDDCTVSFNQLLEWVSSSC
jgi:hypothetical protein